MDALNLAYLLSPTLTCAHSLILQKAQTFSSPPCPLLGFSVSTRIPARKEIRVGLAHTPSPSGPQAASSCWENLHLPRLLQHLQPLCLLKLRLCRQQDVPLPGRGATVYLRGHSEDTEVTRRPLRLCSLTPHPHGTDTPPRPLEELPPGTWGGGGSRKAALPLLSPG